MRKILFAVAVVAGAGCGKDAPKGNAARDAVVDAWKKDGLVASKLAPLTTPVGKDCQAGTVGAIDILLCVYPTDAEAKAAKDAGLAWVGETTGLAEPRGTVLVAIADRKKSDPSGKTINRLIKLASN
jgi:hypothetical protein